MSIESGLWYCESSAWYAIGFCDDYGNLVVLRSGSLFIPSPNWVSWDM